jgi:3-oxoacyl-[acyl-carrier protein] reductase
MALQLDLDGRRALVVGGGGGGIGSAVCERLAAAGADVAAVSNEPTHVAQTIETVESLGGRASGHLADVTDIGELERAIDEAGAELGLLDLVVNVVGGATASHWHRLLDYPMDSFDHLIDTNLRYALVTCQRVARALVQAEQPGAMVNISSVASASAPLLGVYGAAKAGLDSLTRTMAAEWGRYGIRVNNVAPGTINTPRSGRTDLIDDASRLIPLGRRGAPGEIADAAVFLLSDRASYISGHTLVVDGGAGHRSAALDEHDLPVFVTNPAIGERFESD